METEREIEDCLELKLMFGRSRDDDGEEEEEEEAAAIDGKRSKILNPKTPWIQLRKRF